MSSLSFPLSLVNIFTDATRPYRVNWRTGMFLFSENPCHQKINHMTAWSWLSPNEPIGKSLLCLLRPIRAYLRAKKHMPQSLQNV